MQTAELDPSVRAPNTKNSPDTTAARGPLDQRRNLSLIPNIVATPARLRTCGGVPRYRVGVLHYTRQLEYDTHALWSITHGAQFSCDVFPIFLFYSLSSSLIYFSPLSSSPSALPVDWFSASVSLAQDKMYLESVCFVVMGKIRSASVHVRKANKNESKWTKTNQPNRSINQSIDLPIHPSTHPPIQSKSNNQAINQPIHTFKDLADYDSITSSTILPW